MANFKIPGWFVHFKYEHKTGEFNPGAFEAREVRKATGAFNPGAFQERPHRIASGAFSPGIAGEPEEAPVDKDPWGAYYFSLEIDDIDVAHFLECSGLKTSAEVVEIEEGGYLSNVHKRTGRSKWENIILKRAVYTGHLFEEWRDYYMQIPSGGWARRATSTAAIVMRANDGTELRRYSIVQPWPVSWEGPSLSSGGSALAEETLEIAHEGILFGRPPAPQPNPQPIPEPEEPFQPMEFEFDQAVLTPDGQRALEDNVNQLNEDPNAKTYYVEGHTCDLGSHAYNQNLSYQRALKAASDLKDGAKQNNYIPSGHSYDYPVAPNSNESNRCRNRRGNIYPDQRQGLRAGELVYQPMGPNGTKAPRY